ncbi:MAG: hypothetical protein AAGG50_09840 [Bacteroidota bacterium]
MAKFRKVPIKGRKGAFFVEGSKPPGQKVKSISGIERVLSAPLKPKKAREATQPEAELPEPSHVTTDSVPLLEEEEVLA